MTIVQGASEIKAILFFLFYAFAVIQFLIHCFAEPSPSRRRAAASADDDVDDDDESAAADKGEEEEKRNLSHLRAKWPRT